MAAGTHEQAAARDAQAAPILRIVNADATPEEIAVLCAVFSSIQTPATPKTAVVGRTSEWPVTSGFRRLTEMRPRSWRSSRLPH